MHAGLRKHSGARLALGLLLQLTLVALALDYAFHQAFAQARAGGIEQPIANKHSGVRVRSDIHPNPALNKVGGAPALLPGIFFLRVDLKQNLTNWPVLSNHVERSPPFFIVS